MVPLLLFLLAFITYLYWRRPIRPPNFPPGPPLNVLIGNLEYMNPRDGKFRESMVNLRKDYNKDIVGLIDHQGRPFVHVFSYELIKEACSKPECSGRPPLFTMIYRSFMKNQGILFSDGNLWKEHRRFSLQHMKNLGFGKKTMEEIIMNEYEHLKTKLLSSEDNKFLVRTLFNTVVINVIWSLVSSQRFNLDDERAEDLFRSLDDFFKVIGPESKLLMAPWLRHILPRWSGFETLRKHRDASSKMFNEIIEDHRLTLNRNSPRDFVDYFLIEMEKPDAESLGYTEENLCVIGMDFFLAGSETTATALEWAMLYTTMHPHVQEAVIKEIIEVTGGQRPVELNDRAQMPYTEATLMEIQRLSSSIAQTGPHHTSSGPAKLGAYDLPQGTTIFMHLEHLHHNSEHWDDPQVFKPERFLEGSSWKKSPYLIPFGMGKRSCLGETVARMELFLFYTNIIHDFRLSFPEATKPSTERIGLISVHPEPYQLMFNPRS